MPFSFYSPPTLTPEQTNPFNAALTQAFHTYGKGMHAAYLPQTIQADIFSKKFAPLAQIASNPVAMAMMGDQGTGVMKMIQQLLGQQSGEGAFNGSGNNARNFTNIGNGSRQPQMSNNNMSSSVDNNSAGSSYDPSFPQGTNNVGGGLAQAHLAQGSQRPQPGDTVYRDPITGKEYTNPSEKTIAQSTESIRALKRVTPQLEQIAKDAKEFTEPGSGVALKASEWGNWASRMIPGGLLTPERLKVMHIDPDKISRYISFQNNITSVAKDILTAYPNLANSDQSMNLLLQMVRPVEGETTEGYKNRVIKQAENLNQRVSAMQQQMQPLEVGNTSNTAQNTNNGGYSDVSKQFVSRVPNMKNDEEFSSAFNTLNAETKKEVLKLLNEQR